MKRIIAAIIIFLALVGTVYAESKPCISSGLKTADGQIMTRSGNSWTCLCGVEIIPAAADSYVILYDNTSAAGSVLIKATALASSTPGGYAPNGQCIAVTTGIYADVDGADAAYIVWFRE